LQPGFRGILEEAGSKHRGICPNLRNARSVFWDLNDAFAAVALVEVSHALEMLKKSAGKFLFGMLPACRSTVNQR
jgi:hypothetical protein